MSSTLSKSQLIAINTMVNKLHIDKETKAAMVEGFTGGRASSSKDLYFAEAADMIKHLKSLDPEEKAAEVMRRKIIAMAHEMRWHLPGTQKADMKRIDGWCKQYGFRKKQLNNYTYQELPTLVSQFEIVYKQYLSNV